MSKCKACPSTERPTMQGLCTSCYDNSICPYCTKEHDTQECIDKQQREQIYAKYLDPNFLLS